ncbi:MAG: FHIPEP family type III secretion protein, partial [Opitutaceae bacterium]
MPTSSNTFIARLLQRSDLVFTFGLFGTVLLLILPVPPFLLDALLALNIGMSLLVLLAIIYVKDAPEFSGFPTILLTLTLFRLALNISTTRQILGNGYAGHIIDSFGHFVIHGNYIVGAVVFIILVVINFVVITKGAGRIAEVAARFTLDAMPGKQMAIDAELNAGIIDEATATGRRLKIQKEADFYGAMDGASKFVRGDAIAGILIALVNVIGGFAIGVFQMGLTLAESIQKFTLLSIGDGLVAQIPALIISIGAGLLVTRASENNNLGTQIAGQLFRYPRALAIAAGMLVVFGLMPGMPVLPFFALAAAAGLLART